MRKVIGIVVLLVGLLVYIVAMMEVGTQLINTSWWTQFMFYIVAGVAWALPLKPLMAWMHAPSRKAKT